MIQVNADKTSDAAGRGKAAEAADTPEGLLRELDAQIAEALEPKPAPPDAGACPFLVLEPPELSPLRAWAHVHIWDNGDVCEWQARPFSTSIAAAMEVVEKMRGEGFTVEISSDYPDSEWDVVFVRREILTSYACKAVKKGEAGNESLPEAICCAALVAIEQE